MPIPTAGESEKEFISRCIPIVMNDGTAADNEQAAAICYSLWKKQSKSMVDANATITIELSGEDRARLNALKSGARHSANDQQHMDAAMGHMIDAGATHPRLTTEGPMPGMFDPEKSLVAWGGEVKALGDGHFGGYLVRFSDAKSPDLTGDFFTAETDFGFETEAKTPVYFNHRLPLTTKDGKQIILKNKIGEATLTRDTKGILIDAIIQARSEYEKDIVAAGKSDYLGWSSGTAAHLVEREKNGKAFQIKSWPLGLDASLTPTPAEPRNSAITLKAYVDSLTQAEWPALKSVQTQATQAPLPQEKIIMADETTALNPEMAAKFTELLAAVTQIGGQVKAVTDDVAKMKAEPPIKTTGVAAMLQDGKPPAFNQLPKESYADEQLSALKAYLHNEIGKDEWNKHNRKMREADTASVKAWQNLVHSWKDSNMRALGEYETAYKASLVEGTASLGGALVPTVYGNQVIGALKEDSVIRKAGAYQFPVTGTNLFQVPKITRSGSAAIATELAAAAQAEPTFGTQNFTAYAYRAQYIASREQVLDSRVPLDSLLMENAAWQLVQSENNHFEIGTGSSQPQGIAVAASTLGLSPGSTLALAFPDGRAGGDLLMDVYHGLPYQYRDNAVWFMSDTVIKAIRKLRDGSGAAASIGNFLWQPGLIAGQPDRILGRAVYTANNIPSTGSGTAIIAFGDPRFFWIADFNNGGMDFQVLNELYAASAAIGWWFWKRMDSHLLVSESVVGLKLLT